MPRTEKILGMILGPQLRGYLPSPHSKISNAQLDAQHVYSLSPAESSPVFDDHTGVVMGAHVQLCDDKITTHSSVVCTCACSAAESRIEPRYRNLPTSSPLAQHNRTTHNAVRLLLPVRGACALATAQFRASTRHGALVHILSRLRAGGWRFRSRSCLRPPALSSTMPRPSSVRVRRHQR